MDNNNVKVPINPPDQRNLLAQAERKIKQGKNTIKIAVMIHLAYTALLALILASSYSDYRSNLLRSSEGESFLAIIIPVFIADSVLAMLWMYKRVFHTIHLVIYIIFGGWFYLYYLADYMNGTGAAVFAAIFLTPFVWAFGMISFIICAAGRKSLTNAINEYDHYARCLPSEDRSQS